MQINRPQQISEKEKPMWKHNHPITSAGITCLTLSIFCTPNSQPLCLGGLISLGYLKCIAQRARGVEHAFDMTWSITIFTCSCLQGQEFIATSGFFFGGGLQSSSDTTRDSYQANWKEARQHLATGGSVSHVKVVLHHHANPALYQSAVIQTEPVIFLHLCSKKLENSSQVTTKSPQPGAIHRVAGEVYQRTWDTASSRRSVMRHHVSMGIDVCIPLSKHYSSILVLEFAVGQNPTYPREHPMLALKNPHRVVTICCCIPQFAAAAPPALWNVAEGPTILRSKNLEMWRPHNCRPKIQYPHMFPSWQCRLWTGAAERPWGREAPRLRNIFVFHGTFRSHMSAVPSGCNHMPRLMKLAPLRGPKSKF